MHGGKNEGIRNQRKKGKRKDESEGEPKSNIFFITRSFVFLQLVPFGVVFREEIPKKPQGVGSQPFCKCIGEVVFGLHVFDVEVQVFVCLSNPMVFDVHESCVFEVHDAAGCYGDGGLVVAPDGWSENRESKLLFELDHEIEVVCCGIQGDVFRFHGGTRNNALSF